MMGTESANPHPLWPPSCDALQVDSGHRETANNTSPGRGASGAGRWYPSILKGDLPTVPWLFFPACSHGLMTTSSPGFGDLVQGSEASPCGVGRVKTVTCVS